MNYHNITKDDMLNGEGLRVVLWVAGCSHHCKQCHNPITWNANDGILFDEAAKKEIFEQLDNDYISGITFSGGDPLHEKNIDNIIILAKEIKKKYSKKNIWVYSGYELNEIFNVSRTEKEIDREKIIILPGMEKRAELFNYIDVFVDGRFIPELKEENYHWAGSTNQIVWKIEKDTIRNISSSSNKL